MADALDALAGGALVMAAVYLGWWVANRNATNRAAALKLERPMSRDVEASTVDWHGMLCDERYGDVYRVLLDEIELLRQALKTAQGEAYLGTLDSDETPDPLAACHNVIKTCLAVEDETIGAIRGSKASAIRDGLL